MAEVGVPAAVAVKRVPDRVARYLPGRFVRLIMRITNGSSRAEACLHWATVKRSLAQRINGWTDRKSVCDGVELAAPRDRTQIKRSASKGRARPRLRRARGFVYKIQYNYTCTHTRTQSRAEEWTWSAIGHTRTHACMVGGKEHNVIVLCVSWYTRARDELWLAAWCTRPPAI